MSGIGTWFPYRRDRAGLEVFAFPHAGASSTVFNELRGLLQPHNVNLSAAVLPGHGKRLRERPHRRMASLVNEFVQAARMDGFSYFQGDYGMLGHCSGALVAFELAHQLVAAECADPQFLIVCSCLPPQMIFDTGVSKLPVRALIDHTASMGGTPEELLKDPDFLSVIERPLRADWEIYDTYAGWFKSAARAQLPTPILGTRGADDPNCEDRYLQRWGEQTSGHFRTVEFSSGHWALEGDGVVALSEEIHSTASAAGL